MNYRIALVALALMAPALNACSGESGKTTSTEAATIGEIAMAVRLPDGTSINSIAYDINHSNGYNNDGSVAVNNSSLIRFQVGSIPAGVGYTIGLSATTTDGVACTSTPVPFDVTARGTTAVMATLRCGAGGTNVVGSDAGNVRVNVGVEQVTTVVCPQVDGLTALPLEVSVGSSISLIGYATTAPSTTFGWSAPAGAGSFSAATAAVTSFTCQTAGDHVVALAINGAATCPTSTESVTVTCTGVPGTPDAGPVVPDAGPVVPDAGPDSGPVVPDAGPDSGPVVPDAGPDSGPVVPDAGPVVPDAGPDSGPPVDPDLACKNCRAANCADFQGINLVAGCFERVDPDLSPDSVGDPNFIQQCIDVITCARTNNCAYSETSGPAGCYCGNITVDACQASGPAAGSPCTGVWQAAARSTVNADVQLRLTDVTYPAGWAYFLLQCDLQFCAGAGCTSPIPH